MATMKSVGPGGRVARAQKRLGRAVSKLPASTDSSSEYTKKMSNIDKTKSKVAKGVAKLDKAVAKTVDKKREQMSKSKDLENFMTSTSAPVRRGLSDLDKFDKRIKVRKLAKEAKPAARDYNKRIKK